MLDMIDVTIERRFFLVRADEDSVDSDNAAAGANRFDLFVGHVPLDVVEFSRVRVRNDHGFSRDGENIVEAGRTNVGEIDDDAELFAFANYVAAERREAAARRTAGSKKAAVTGGVAPSMGKTKRTQPKLVKDVQQIEVGTERLDAFHREKERNLVLLPCLQNLAVAPANRETI